MHLSYIKWFIRWSVKIELINFMEVTMGQFHGMLATWIWGVFFITYSICCNRIPIVKNFMWCKYSKRKYSGANYDLHYKCYWRSGANTASKICKQRSWWHWIKMHIWGGHFCPLCMHLRHLLFFLRWSDVSWLSNYIWFNVTYQIEVQFNQVAHNFVTTHNSKNKQRTCIILIAWTFL